MQLGCTITWRLSRQMAGSLLQQLSHLMSRLALQSCLMQMSVAHHMVVLNVRERHAFQVMCIA